MVDYLEIFQVIAIVELGRPVVDRGRLDDVLEVVDWGAFLSVFDPAALNQGFS